ncbi:MAG: hypothetical protein ACE5F1_03710 [Planctomycetota bacterium]
MRISANILVLASALFAPDPAKPKTASQATKPAAQTKLPPFPKDQAKWVVHGKVKGDAVLADRVPGPRVYVPGGKPKDERLQVRSDQISMDMTLPGAVITVSDLERRWRFETKRRTHRITITKERRFVPSTVVLDVRDRATCVNLSAAPVWLTLRASGPRSSYSWPIAHGKKLLIDSIPRLDAAFAARTVQEEIRGSWNSSNDPRGTCLTLASTVCQDSQCWLYLSSHPVFAVSDEHGRFSLPKLPDGEYELVAIHELLGKLTKKVKIEGKPKKWVEFVFEVPKRLRAKPTGRRR